MAGSQKGAQEWHEIGLRIRQAREHLSLTQDAVASHLGVTRPVISNIENGLRRVNLSELEKLAALFGFPITHFFAVGRDDDSVAALFRSKEISENDRLKLNWLHGFLTDWALIRDIMEDADASKSF